MTGSDEAQKTITIGIEGMMCAHCVKRVETVLGRLPGVGSVTVTLAKKQAVVVYNPSLTTPEAMEQAITGAGYQYIGIVPGV